MNAVKRAKDRLRLIQRYAEQYPSRNTVIASVPKTPDGPVSLFDVSIEHAADFVIGGTHRLAEPGEIARWRAEQEAARSRTSHQAALDAARAAFAKERVTKGVDDNAGV